MRGKAQRRLLSLFGQLVSPEACAAASVRPAATTEEIFGPQQGLFSRAYTSDADPLGEARLKELFGPEASVEGPLASSGIGRRFHNLDVSKPLTEAQAAYLIDALSAYALVVFAKQDLRKVSLAHYERFANHFGAVQPMFANQDTSQKYYDQNKLPMEDKQKKADAVNAKLAEIAPGQIQHLPDPLGSSAIITVTNVEPKGVILGPTPQGKKDTGQVSETIRSTLLWHTDQDHERISCNATMFLVHKSPTARDPAAGTWLTGWPEQGYETWYKKDPLPEGLEHFHKTDPDLVKLRKVMPLNAETAFADTAAAFEALPKAEQERLEKINLVKYKQVGDDVQGKGYYCPLVRTNPRTGRKFIYSPCYGSRIVVSNVPPAEIEGMTPAETKAFLDKIETHCLQPQFRYDHLHREGDLVVWDDYATLHCAPPVKIGITSLEDARLYYRISTKGGPSLTLPRQDPKEWLLENFTSTYTTTPEIIAAGSK